MRMRRSLARGVGRWALRARRSRSRPRRGPVTARSRKTTARRRGGERLPGDHPRVVRAFPKRHAGERDLRGREGGRSTRGISTPRGPGAGVRRRLHPQSEHERCPGDDAAHQEFPGLSGSAAQGLRGGAARCGRRRTPTRPRRSPRRRSRGGPARTCAITSAISSRSWRPSAAITRRRSPRRSRSPIPRRRAAWRPPRSSSPATSSIGSGQGPDRALKLYQELLERYPNSPLAPEVRAQVLEMRKKLQL